MVRQKRGDKDIEATQSITGPIVPIRRVLGSPARDYHGAPGVEGLQVKDDLKSLFPPLCFSLSTVYRYPEEIHAIPAKDLNNRYEPATISFLSNTPLYTLEELERRTQAVLSHLERNRIPLVKTGHPEANFERSRWFDARLVRLYYVKLPMQVTGTRNRERDFAHTYTWPNKVVDGLCLPYPESLESMVAFVRSYQWAADSRAKTEDGVPACSCAYEDAALLQGLNPSEAKRLDEERGKFLDLKMAILQKLLDAVHSRDDIGLGESCLQLIVDTFTAEEIAFYERMDRFYLGFDLNTQIPGDTAGQLFPGGLTDLLGVIGHYEKELTIGTLAKTRKALGELVERDWLGRPFLAINRLESQQIEVLNTAIDLYLLLRGHEQTFWVNYSCRVQEALKGGGPDTIPVPRELLPYVRGILQVLKNPYEATSASPTLASSAVLPHSTPPSLPSSEGPPSNRVAFSHSTDFRSVTVHGRRYTFTEKQAQVVELLWEAYQSATPELGQQYILEEELDSTSKRLRDLFRTSDAWGTLIVPGSKRGTFRLNIL